jgi:hypothetical protein
MVLELFAAASGKPRDELAETARLRVAELRYELFRQSRLREIRPSGRWNLPARARPRSHLKIPTGECESNPPQSTRNKSTIKNGTASFDLAIPFGVVNGVSGISVGLWFIAGTLI